MANPFTVVETAARELAPAAERAGQSLLEASGILGGKPLYVEGERALDRLLRVEKEAGVGPLASRIQDGDLRMREAGERIQAGSMRAELSRGRADSIRNGTDPRWTGVPLSDDHRLQGHPGFKDINGDNVVTSQDGRLVRTSVGGIQTLDFGEHLAGHRQTMFGDDVKFPVFTADGAKTELSLGGISITDHPLGDRMTSFDKAVLTEKADGRMTTLVHGQFERTQWPNGSFDFTRTDGVGASVRVNDRDILLQTFGPGERLTSEDTMPRWALRNLNLTGSATLGEAEQQIKYALQRRSELDKALQI